MSDLAIFSADLAAVNTVQLVVLPITDFAAAERNVDEATAYLRQLHAKLDTVKLRRYGEQARSVLRDSGRDFGTAHVSDGALHVRYEFPKKVTWSQAILKKMAECTAVSGDKVEDHIDIKLSVSESRYTNWPTALQEQSAAARTVEGGKPSITLTPDGGAAWRSSPSCPQSSGRPSTRA